MPARAQLSRDDLIGGLQMLVRMQGRKKKTGRAHWQFDVDGLTIIWGEAQQLIDARVTEPGTGSIEGDVMRNLAAQLPRDDVLELVAERHRVKIGSLLIDTAGVIDRAAAQLPPGATDLEILTVAIRLTREEWREAGIEERVDQAIARSKQAVREAAAVLTPFGIDELSLSRLLNDTIRARSSDRRPRSA